MGSKNMGPVLKAYCATHYAPGKRDLYAAFALRCCELARPDGYVGMVTQQSWLLLHTFAAFRAGSEDDPHEDRTGVLYSTTIEALAHLGPRAFAEVGGEVVNTVLFTFRQTAPTPQHHLSALRCVEAAGPSEKEALLAEGASSGRFYKTRQIGLHSIPGSPVVYWLSPELLALFQEGQRFQAVLKTKQGVVTGNNDRFLRYHWEAPEGRGYTVCLKGLGYQRWYGFTDLVIEWKTAQLKIARFDVGRIKQQSDFVRQGWSYSSMAQGAMSPREYQPGWVYDVVD